MAGAGSRFSKAGFEKPKPFIDVCGKPMIVRVLENLYYPNARYILIARQEHLEKEAALVSSIERSHNASFIAIDNITEGTACTVLFARHLIRSSAPVVVANSDQIIDVDFEKFIDDALSRKLDGSILTFIDPEKSEKWSFAKLDNKGYVERVEEKKPISEYATAGIYFFKNGEHFIEHSVQMIIENNRSNNEFYVCPIYNYLIKKNESVGIYNISAEEMHGIGTPEDLERYISGSSLDLG